jgi:hypothetical protein
VETGGEHKVILSCGLWRMHFLNCQVELNFIFVFLKMMIMRRRRRGRGRKKEKERVHRL